MYSAFLLTRRGADDMTKLKNSAELMLFELISEHTCTVRVYYISEYIHDCIIFQLPPIFYPCLSCIFLSYPFSHNRFFTSL